MARHKFDGVWRYYFMANVVGSLPGDARELDLRKADNTNGDLDSGSRLHGTNLTGRIRGNLVDFEHPLGGGFKRVFSGKHFLGLPDGSGQIRLVLAGQFRKEPMTLAAKKKAKSKAALTGQEDGTWIAVKP